MKIALAINLPLPSDLESFDSDKWPGSEWIKSFKKLATKYGHTVHLAQDIAANERDVRLIQEEMCTNGAHLTHAEKAITFNLESVMYSPQWYKCANDLGFKRVMQFGDSDFYFPSFKISDVVPGPIKERDLKLCMIMSNKHYRGFNITPPISQLHDYRYQVIEWATKNYGLHLYGYGWGGFAKPVENKLDVLKKYKASIIIENDAKRGYFTEKAVHAIISGCQPIYYGDPRHFYWKLAEPSDLEDSILSLNDSGNIDEWNDFRNEWLRNDAKKYTYDSFAMNMFENL